MTINLCKDCAHCVPNKNSLAQWDCRVGRNIDFRDGSIIVEKCYEVRIPQGSNKDCKYFQSMQQAIRIKIHDEFATGLDSVDDGSGGL